jgi:hypothetical protein
LLYHIGVFTRIKNGKLPRVGEIFKYPNENDNSPNDYCPVQITIILQKPLKINTGQYINIYIPSLGIRSSMQTYPFVVASWTGKE